MSKSFRTTLEALESLLANSGYMTSVEIGEPKSAPNDWHGAVILSRFQVLDMTLTSAIEERNVIVRVYANLDHADRQDIEIRMLDLYQQIKTLIDGDFNMSGYGTSEIRDHQPAAMSMQMGYQLIDTGRYRLMDVTVPLIVDDAATFAA